MLTRVVRYINVSIGLLALLIAVIIYWFAVRPLPKTSGHIHAPIASPALIKRDVRGVPHIEAQSIQDAMFLQGFVTAQDRLWQIDTLRRFGKGELSEVFGSATLAVDERVRRMRMRVLADKAADRLPEADRMAFAAYARGVNFFIDSHRGKYALEFSLPGHAYDPKPWTISDSIAVGMVMFRNLTDSASEDFDRGVLYSIAADPVKMQYLFPPVAGAGVSPGSNAWAVSGSHTTDGSPMLANDTHLEYSIPATWYLVHLKAPGLDVSGCSLPGVPGVVVGHNRQIAWGVTNLESDVMDLYAEQLDDRTGKYVFQGRVEQAQLDTESIAVRAAKSRSVKVWVTRHGPILITAPGRNYAMRWSANEGFGFPFFAIDKASNWQEFRSALTTFWGPAQNFVYADRAGNIGYQAAGRIPIRHGFHSNVPLDGQSGKFEWDGYIPFEQLPSIYNPPSGIIATANQNPYPPGAEVDGGYAAPYRVNQIRALLSAKARLEVTDMLAIEKDVYSAYDRFLAQQAVAAVQRKGAKSDLIRQASDVLRSWNGQMDKDEAAPAITRLLSNEMGSAVVLLLIRLPANVRQRFVPPLLAAPLIMQGLLQTRPAGWVPGDDWDAWLVKELGDAVETGRSHLGSPLLNWRWGQLQQWNLVHPVGKQLPFVDRYFDIGPVEMSGSGTTVKQTTTKMGPSERMVIDLGDLEKSVANITVGESGHVASPHYRDEWPSYYVGNSFPMQFDQVDGKDILHISPAAASN